jgi:hypothetical protein
MTRISCLVVASFAVAQLLAGQGKPDTSRNRFDRLLESLLENDFEETHESELPNILQELRDQPIDLNVASVHELNLIPCIDPVLAYRIVLHRDRQHFRSVDDLLSVEGMDMETFLRARDFVFVRSEAATRRTENPFSLQVRARTVRDLQTRRGYRDGTYEGSPYKTFTRAIVRQRLSGRFLVEAGGLAEKDAGEIGITDFSSGFIRLEDTDSKTQVILGDFIVESGQGLVFWRPSGISKGSEVIASVTKNPRGLVRYSSTDENGFLRGIAAGTAVGPARIMAFYSAKRINATLDEQGIISSFNTSGLFRTTSEHKSRQSSEEIVRGMEVNYCPSPRWRLGLRGYTSGFRHPVELLRNGESDGRNASLAGLDASLTTGSMSIFGEGAIDHASSFAGVGGIIVQPVTDLQAAIVVRSYSRTFTSLHGNGFGSTAGGMGNEQGIYGSVKASLLDWLTLSAYYDMCKHPDVRELSDLASGENDFLASARLQASKRLNLEFLCKLKSRSITTYVPDQYSRTDKAIGIRQQANYRATLEWFPSPDIRWRSRIEMTEVNFSSTQTGERGYLAYQDLRWKPWRNVSIDMRGIVFESGSYDTRMYEYESELQGTSSVPALFGRGIRLYVLVRYGMTRVECSAKYSSTIKHGTLSIGSEANEIRGDLDNQVSIQLDYKL